MKRETLDKKIPTLFIVIFFTFCNLGNHNTKEENESLFTNFGLLFSRANRLTVSGSAVKGIVKNGKVLISTIGKDGSCNSSQSLATGTTDITGLYSISYNKVGGMICITISGDQNTTMYDEKSGKDLPVPSTSDFKLVSILPESKFSGNAKKNALISPFSKLLSKRMETLIKQAGEGADVSALYKKASKEVVIRFGLSSGLSSASQKNKRLLEIRPSILDSDYPELDDLVIELDNPNSPISAKYLSVLAGFSQLANSYKKETEVKVTDVDSVINAFASDFEDGVFDGKNGSGNTVTVGSGERQLTFSSNPLTTILLPAISTYLQEGGNLSVGVPGTATSTITITQFTNQTQFNDNSPIISTTTTTTPTTTPTPTPVVTPITLSITAFSFTDTVNGLSKTYNGIIAGSNITIDIPYGKLSSAIPSITTNATTIMAPSAVTSGVTMLDFTNPITFTLSAANAANVVYTVAAYPITPVADTGQTICFNNPTPQGSCATTTATFPNQDGELLNFPNAKGTQAISTNAGYPNDPINRDILKGIVWKTCHEGQTGPTCAGGTASTNNHASASTLCGNLNSANSGAGYAGLKNWRLPNVYELNQLLELNGSTTNNNYWNATFFPNAPAGGLSRWTSSLILPAATSAMTQTTEYIQTQATSTPNYVQCVSGPTSPAFDMVDNGDGTIFDKRTKLIWQRCAFGQTNDATCSGALATKSWANSLLDCKNLTLAGKSWRLPNANEFLTLVDLSITTVPKVNPTLFPNFGVANYETSSTNQNNLAYSHIFDTNATSFYGLSGKGATYNSRCVAGPE
ncbi:MAG: DUF1566 domain-containing protein [Leptospiraceae bacterium]|nr:DUF1566 domain-containing protein [Leptospiraceae bacterium]